VAGGWWETIFNQCQWKVSRKPTTSWLATNFRGSCDSLYQHYLGFKKLMHDALWVLLSEESEKQVEMGLAKDRSGVGGVCH